MQNDNRDPADERPDGGHETGARKPLEGESRRYDGVHSGDKGDAPKKPYGLTEPHNDRGDAARHHDGVQPKEQQGQFAPSQADSRNDGTVSAEPRTLTGDEDGDATFPLDQDR